jgi:biotin operon repressor
MEITEKILETLKKSANPMSAGEIAEKTGIDRKEIDKAMKVLKDSGKIISPRRCYWTAGK